MPVRLSKRERYFRHRQAVDRMPYRPSKARRRWLRRNRQFNQREAARWVRSARRERDVHTVGVDESLETVSSDESDGTEVVFVNAPPRDLVRGRPYRETQREAFDRFQRHGKILVTLDRNKQPLYGIARCPHCENFCEKHRVYPDEFKPPAGLFGTEAWKNRKRPVCTCGHECGHGCNWCSRGIRSADGHALRGSQNWYH
jgi:hypothetical protein